MTGWEFRRHDRKDPWPDKNSPISRILILRREVQIPDATGRTRTTRFSSVSGLGRVSYQRRSGRAGHLVGVSLDDPKATNTASECCNALAVMVRASDRCTPSHIGVFKKGRIRRSAPNSADQRINYDSRRQRSRGNAPARSNRRARSETGMLSCVTTYVAFFQMSRLKVVLPPTSRGSVRSVKTPLSSSNCRLYTIACSHGSNESAIRCVITRAASSTSNFP